MHILKWLFTPGFLSYSWIRKLLYRWPCTSNPVLWRGWCPMGIIFTCGRQEPQIIYSPFFPLWTFRRHSNFKRSHPWQQLWSSGLYTGLYLFSFHIALIPFFLLSCFPEITIPPKKCYHMSLCFRLYFLNWA